MDKNVSIKTSNMSEDEALTFSELRKIQKSESRQDNLTELDDNFILKVADYLKRKKDMSGGEREYKNAKRVFDKIISLRQEKIVKNAQIAVKSGLNTNQIDMLPEEQELFRESKDIFKSHEDKINRKLDEMDPEAQIEQLEEETVEEVEEDEDEEEENYVTVMITSDVPEFMGTDLESYGPFDDGEQVELPEENAEILVNRGSAERL